MTLEILTSDLLSPARHGFFTRRGGASAGIFTGLNCGVGSSDQSDVVALNRGLVAEAMGVAPANLLSVHQIHSPDVVRVTAPWAADNPKADAMVTNTPGIALGILTADCAPILFSDTKNKVVGAAHSGWKGAIAGVAQATIDAMENLGAQRQNIIAIVGPTISQRAYEVGPEFFEEFFDKSPNNARFFTNGKDGHIQFDLVSFVLHHLRETGISQASWTGHCTYSDPARFYSFRRTTHACEADYGRLISVIRL